MQSALRLAKIWAFAQGVVGLVLLILGVRITPSSHQPVAGEVLIVVTLFAAVISSLVLGSILSFSKSSPVE